MRLGRSVRRLLSRVTPGGESYPDSQNPTTARLCPGIRVSRVAKSICEKNASSAAPATALSCGASFYPVYQDYPDRGREIKGSGLSGYRGADPVYRDYPDRQPPWTDDRTWIRLWRDAGPTLAERLPVLEAWLATAPPPPLPRRLAALELARIARNHGITVTVEIAA
jgi:hypothetical protein